MTGNRLEEKETNHMAIYTRYWILFIVALTAPFHDVSAGHDSHQGLLVFLNGGPVYNQVTSEDGIQENNFILGTDIIYSYLKGDFRFLAEYILSTEESELERFQLGWQADEDTIGWLGRFHSPSRYWNSAYHHGLYLQTSITRPLVEKFEDEGGIVPTHVSGLMLEAMHKLQGTAGFQTTFSFGATSVIGEHELEPFDVLDARSGHEAAVDLRLAYLPDQLGENQFGLLLNWSNMVVDGNHIAEQQGLESVEQGSVGVYADWRKQDWRILANLTYITNQMIKQVQEQTDSFSAVYIQAEYELNQDWKVFGRIEDTAGADNSEYLELFPFAVLERQMLGLRFDFYTNNALTVELSNVKLQADEFGQAWLQWTAVLP
ncbi:MAG: hypothetical protein DRQ44_03530 [Gammaproteobacteria bacterium]|nr:MAG: hypothetical protein DRQ44_03530 [Gammaproteobacteria bacterium]